MGIEFDTNDGKVGTLCGAACGGKDIGHGRALSELVVSKPYGGRGRGSQYGNNNENNEQCLIF